MLHRLMLIADQQGARGRPLPDVVVQAANGVGGRLIVQFRERDLGDAELSDLIRAVQRRVPPQTVLIVNNRPAVAGALNIGLHLPAAADLTADAAADRYPLLGRSVHNEAEAQTAIADAVDYAIVGTIFETASHPGRPAAGLEHLAAIQAILGDIPTYAIGGITPQTAPQASAAGAHGLAVRSAILAAPNPAEAAYRLSRALPP